VVDESEGIMESDILSTKTLDELRALARTAGLRGYSALRKNQLIEVLAKHKARPSAASTARTAAAKKTGKSKSARAKATAAPRAGAVTPRPAVAAPALSAEERIESAKFEMTPPGMEFAQPRLSSLHENIDELPTASEPMLCLLPQKPGVVHAYWVLPSGASTANLKLRLCAFGETAIEILEEIELPSERGHWYFHIPDEAHPGTLLAHLGYYDAAGEFVTAIRRGIARIPSLYASARTDRAWWISDTDFRAMYLRAGGVLRGRRLAWGEAAASSPGYAPSSRQK
jgi:hypothetical protein